MNRIMFDIQYFIIRFCKSINKKLYKGVKEKDLSEKISIVDESIEIPDGAIELKCEVAPVFNNRKGIVTIISDDGYFKSVKLLNELLSYYDLKCSVAGIIRWVRKNEKQWKDILAKGNIELINHSFDHIKMSEDSRIAKDLLMLEREISDSFIYLNKKFNIPSICFVCPENQMCSNGYDILKKNGVFAVRKGDRGLNSLSPNVGYNSGDWYNLKTFGIMDSDCSTKIRNSWVDNAINEKKWLIEMWHNVSINSDKYYQTILIGDAKEHLKYIKEKNDSGEIWVANFSEATKYLYECKESKAKAYYYKNHIYIKVIINSDILNQHFFNHPLSIIVNTSDLPEDVKELIKSNQIIKNVFPGELLEFKVK